MISRQRRGGALGRQGSLVARTTLTVCLACTPDQIALPTESAITEPARQRGKEILDRGLPHAESVPGPGGCTASSPAGPPPVSCAAGPGLFAEYVRRGPADQDLARNLGHVAPPRAVRPCARSAAGLATASSIAAVPVARKPGIALNAGSQPCQAACGWYGGPIARLISPPGAAPPCRISDEPCSRPSSPAPVPNVTAMMHAALTGFPTGPLETATPGGRRGPHETGSPALSPDRASDPYTPRCR
jgi:hypothetical protein